MSCTQENNHVNDSKMIRQAAHRAVVECRGVGGGDGQPCTKACHA